MGLIGPWSHKYPHFGEPGPPIGFLQETLRWWDFWLKDKETGINNEPMIRAWMQESVPPSTSYKERPGYWVGLKSWPSEIVSDRTFSLAPGKLLEHKEPTGSHVVTIQSPLRLGLFAGKWCSYNAPPDLPGDQREEDGGALVFDSDPLQNDLEIIGAPHAHFYVRADKPVAMIAVRLADIAPDGKATRVTYGILNLTHYRDHEHPDMLKPNAEYQVRIRLNDIAHQFPRGHRIRVAVSTSYWPLAWPSPEMATLSVCLQKSRFVLPAMRKKGIQDIQFKPAECAKPVTQQRTLHTPNYQWNVIRDLIRDQSTLHVIKDEGAVVLEDINLLMQRYTEEKYSVRNDDLDTLEAETCGKTILQRNNWKIETRTRTVLTCDPSYFYLHATLDAFEGDERLFAKNWQKSIKRDHV